MSELEMDLVEKESKPCDVVDGKHTYFYCSNCNAPLLDIWHLQPTDQTIWKVRADCPFCDDHSFVKDIDSFHFGPTGLYCPDGPYCSVGDHEIVEINGEEIIVFKMIKTREHINE